MFGFHKRHVEKHKVQSGVCSLLLWLLVQLHVRHQDVLLRLLRQAGVGAAVAGPFVRPPRTNGLSTVQVDHADDQQHQQQARYRDDDQSGEVVVFSCGRESVGMSVETSQPTELRWAFILTGHS